MGFKLTTAAKALVMGSKQQQSSQRGIQWTDEARQKLGLEPNESFFDDDGNEVLKPQQNQQASPLGESTISPEDQELFDVTEEGIEQLAFDEGERFTMYKDSENIPTIGVGFNLTTASNKRIFKRITGFSVQEALDGKEISKRQSRELLQESLAIAQKDAEGIFRPAWDKLNDEERDALVNFAFNLGKTRALTFKKAIKALNAGDGVTAAKEMLDSKWARQVGDRAKRIADVVRRIDFGGGVEDSVDVPDAFIEVDLED